MRKESLHNNKRSVGTISVVVPVYNAEKYVGRCVSSICSQTYTDIEIILVDDGSQDGSGAILDKCAADDVRIKTVHQQNAGVMAARAAGVWLSHGKWLCFVDADDTMKADALESMADLADGDAVLVALENDEDCTLNAAQFAQLVLSFKGFSVWGKLFRRDLLDEYALSVPRHFKVGEDFLTILRVLKNINSGGGGNFKLFKEIRVQCA